MQIRLCDWLLTLKSTCKCTFFAPRTREAKTPCYVILAEKTNVTGGLEFEIQTHPGNRVRYTWDFGDGQSENTTDMTIKHVYTEAGVYTVSLYSYNDVSDYTVIVSPTAVELAFLLPEVVSGVFTVKPLF